MLEGRMATRIAQPKPVGATTRRCKSTVGGYVCVADEARAEALNGRMVEWRKLLGLPEDGVIEDRALMEIVLTAPDGNGTTVIVITGDLLVETIRVNPQGKIADIIESG